jgi:molybdopterin-guanine dinucleotide biosynthesis protein A
VNSIILAGGKGLRLGCNKAFIELEGENLLKRIISRLSFIGGDIIIVTAGDEQLFQKTVNKRVNIVKDIYTAKGPLIGIYSGLVNSNSPFSFVVACDMPFLNRELIIYLMEVSNGFDITIPRLGKYLEPLHAVYSKNCLGAISNLLVDNSLKIDRLLDMVKVRYVEKQEIDDIDPEHLSFFNVNTNTDLDIAKELADRAASRKA